MAGKLGHVYIVSRVDLMKCYIGQSIHDGRRNTHTKPGNYRYDALCADGTSAHVDVLEDTIPQGEQLDAAEREWMRTFTEIGWTLINKLGPDDPWPQTTFDVLSAAGKKGGVVGGNKTQQHRREDPEFDAYWRAVAARAGGKALKERRAADSELDARMKEAEALGGRRSVAARAILRASNPAWRDAEIEQMRRAGAGNKGKIGGNRGTQAMVAKNRKCVTCGREANSGNMGQHLRASGHAGFITINSAT